MSDLYYEASATTPAVELDSARGRLEIRGESYPENALEFYRPVISAVDELLEGSETGLTILIDLSYLNTSSVKVLMDILDSAEEAHQAGAPVTVEWRYDQDNDRSLEMAEEFQEDLSLPFEMVPVAR
jgi:hypothetical protein